MAGGTLFLIMVTFTILSRVVIRPVEVMAKAADRVAQMVDDAVAKGGRLVLKPERKGAVLGPAIVSNAPGEARLMEMVGKVEMEISQLDEEEQAEFLKNCWVDIISNSDGYGAGNAIGGVQFEWVDEWWKAYEPSLHDSKPLWGGSFPDGWMHEEWLGVTSQGDGKHSPFKRVLRKGYFTYKKLWRSK